MNPLSNSFLIHHLTDIHVGPLHYKASRKLPFVHGSDRPRNLDLYIEDLRQREKSDLPDLVIVSGDFASTAEEDEMNAAGDALRNILAIVERKRPSWRDTKSAPYLVIVPGNHDLDWKKEKDRDKIERYARMADSLYQDGKVLSSVYHSESRPVYADFGDEINIFVYLFNTTSLGGVKDPAIIQVANNLKSDYEQLQNQAAQGKFEEHLNALENEARRDPGFFLESDLQKMAACLARVPSSRIVIGVMHHNPSSVPSDDIEAFDAIINAGIAKDLFIQKRFDIIFHGHRHIAHCGHERILRNPDIWQQGLFIISGDSLGCKETAPFFEVRLFDTKCAHQDSPPASLFTVDLFTHLGNEYTKQRTFAEEALGRPMYEALGDVLRRLGRDLDTPVVSLRRRHILLKTLRKIMPHLQAQLLQLVDWGDKSHDWTYRFHFHLHKYHSIYATDVYRRQSVGNPRFDNYLRDQYSERLKRLLGSSSRSLVFSRPVHEAILRTGWEPHPIMWQDYGIHVQNNETSDDLEIVRILVRPENVLHDREDLENLYFDHQLFAIPLFVLPPMYLSDGQTVDFALGCDKDRDVLSCFEYSEEPGRVSEVSPSGRGLRLRSLFLEMLNNKALMTLDQFLGYRPMIRDSWKLKEFAATYDNSRKPSSAIVDALRCYLRPEVGKVGLDIGCGTGNYTLPFEGEFGELIGLDKLEEMLQVAKTKSKRVRWIQADALDSTLPDQYCDAVWLISTLHYFKDERQRLLFTEIYRILKPGGVVVADTEFAEQHASLWLVEYFPSLRARYKGACLSTEQYDKWLRQIGFSHVNYEHIDYNATEADAFLRIGQKEPSLYLKERIRRGLPAFQEMQSAELERGLNRLEEAILKRTINQVILRYEQQATMRGDIGLIVATR
jgi:ubiquinone/menaquinone biosynthesis C-methylase UbiE